MSGLLTVCVLGCGDHTALLARCLDSIYAHLPSPHVAEVRLGLNGPSGALATLAEDRLYGAAAPSGTDRVPARLQVRTGPESSYPKYPMMRRLFSDPPIATEYVMWFDDDSFIRPECRDPFFAVYAALLRAGPAPDLVGAPYTIGLRPGQAAWIRAQPWYRGIDPGTRQAFLQGAWWIGRTAALRAWDYPWPDLVHNGGDVMLGALARQQGWRIHHSRLGVAINADGQGRESRGVRRPLGHASLPLGAVR